MILYCTHCEKNIKARLTNGAELYPHRADLAQLPFWVCSCGNFVGCHHKTSDTTKPLGCIPTKEIKEERRHIHKLLDPVWKSGRISRKSLYAQISDKLGYPYHTAEIRSVEEAREIYKIILEII